MTARPTLLTGTALLRQYWRLEPTGTATWANIQGFPIRIQVCGHPSAAVLDACMHGRHAWRALLMLCAALGVATKLCRATACMRWAGPSTAAGLADTAPCRTVPGAVELRPLNRDNRPLNGGSLRQPAARAVVQPCGRCAAERGNHCFLGAGGGAHSRQVLHPRLALLRRKPAVPGLPQNQLQPHSDLAVCADRPNCRVCRHVVDAAARQRGAGQH